MQWRDAAGVLALGVLMRLAVGLSSYSGQGMAPMYGDYEAQRHWMEVTVGLPLHQWYTGAPGNDLAYWGLDYPPLTAYQSWLYGKVIGWCDPEAVALGTSRGLETPGSKRLMRWSVLATDLAVFIPALLACSSVFHGEHGRRMQLWALAASLLQPAALLIDHGHFQYNGLSLGLAAGAAAAVASRRHLLGSCLYCCALNHKQMALYYAPAFFGHLLGRCLQRGGAMSKVWGVMRLGMVVILTFAALWAPFAFAPAGKEGALALDLQGFKAVLLRLVPLQRGLFEDYVANFWCATHALVKWKRLLSLQVQVRACSALTLLAALPSMVHQMLRPSSQGLLLAMANSAFAFFLFSFQVHEKSILLPLMPLLLASPQQALLSAWLPVVASFSMYPLLARDGLQLAYAACLLLWAGLCLLAPVGGKPEAVRQPDGSGLKGRRRGRWWPGSPLGWAGSWRTHGVRCVGLAMACSVLAAACVHVLMASVQPPVRLRFLYDALIVTLSFGHFLAAAAWLNASQWLL